MGFGLKEWTKKRKRKKGCVTSVSFTHARAHARTHTHARTHVHTHAEGEREGKATVSPY